MENKRGFYTYSHESSVIIAPPLVITESQLNEAFDIFEEVLQDFEANYLFKDKEEVISVK